MSQEYPLVTVIVPVRNEEKFMGRSLTAIFEQDYPAARLQVLIADGMSTDGTRAVVNSFRHHFHDLEVIDNPGQIVPTGMNAALARAAGDIIVRVDGHCEIARDYVSNCVRHLQHDGVDGVGGPLDTIGETFMARLIATAMSSSFGVGGSAFRTVRGQTQLTDTVAFPAYTREALQRAGPYDEELVRNQDDEYNYRLRKLGAKILLADDVRAKYYSRSSLKSLWRQYYQYGYWKVRVMQKHTWQMQPRHFVPGLFIASLLGLLVLSPFSVVARWLVIALGGLYLLVNLLASMRAALNCHASASEKLKLMLWLPVTFATLHGSYGFGFLAGLVRFWNRWGDKSTRATSEQQARHKKLLETSR